MTRNNSKKFHVPVMVKEVLKYLKVKKEGVYFDGTVGGGGHTEAVLRKSQIPNSKFQICVIAVDWDIEAIEFTKKRLKKYEKNIIFIHDNFKHLSQILEKLKIDKVDGILLDLGVSSYQLDTPSRGFSFKLDKKQISLDMRMDKNQKFSAYDVVNYYSQEQLTKLFFKLGEEPFARQIARQITIRRQEKPIATTNDLLIVIKSATPPKYRFSRRVHWASKIFRAIRMEVNHELSALREVLPQSIDKLKKGGRIVIISFHSLEDRIVKNFFREEKKQGRLKILTKKPIMASTKEMAANPRARSAKLRAAEKMR